MGCLDMTAAIASLQDEACNVCSGRDVMKEQEDTHVEDKDKSHIKVIIAKQLSSHTGGQQCIHSTMYHKALHCFNCSKYAQ
jgi:hypothetical protein